MLFIWFRGDIMKKKVSIFMFIDAFGWEIQKNHTFLEELLPYRYPAKMQFGYSCTAIPTILTGKTPVEHKHLSFYYYNPKESPFKMFKVLKFLPGFIFDRWRFRHLFSKAIKKMKGYTGYFELYAMPFDRLPYFDYIEKKDLFVPNGLAPTKNLADVLEEKKLNYHISNWRLTEDENIEALMSDIRKEELDFAFLYTAKLDGLLHSVTKDGSEIQAKLDWYAEKIKLLVAEVKKHYEDYSLFIMSDHGMTTLTHEVDVKKQIEDLGYKFGKDYVAAYDSTMVHFWFLNKECREPILKEAKKVPHSSLISEADKVRFGINYADNMYGDEILLMDAGTQIVPCDMGRNSLPGMHGFSPDHKDSDASFMGTEPLNTPPKWVGDFFRIMTEYMDK